MLKKLITILLSVAICISLCITVSAEGSGTPTIKLSNVSAMPGDSVTINIDISNNPGIMAIAFCVTYDKDAFEFEKETFDSNKSTSGYITSPTYTDHSDKGHISFSYVGTSDKATNGTMLAIPFKIKNTAKAGKHTIAIANSNREKYGYKLHNSFSNSKQQAIVPTVIAGSITVGETCENSGHKYGDYTIIKSADCTNTGLKNHVCERCQFSEDVIIPITHDFESDWTIDKQATPQEDGIMSRHCTKCQEVTDTITFSYKEITGGDESSDQTASNNSSSDTSSVTSNTEQTTPNIENVVGEKVPVQEVEKFEDYQQNIKPNLDNSSQNEESTQESSSQTTSDDSTLTTGTVSNDTNSSDDESSASKGASNIIILIISLLLSIGILALGIILIIRNKKSKT